MIDQVLLKKVGKKTKIIFGKNRLGRKMKITSSVSQYRYINGNYADEVSIKQSAIVLDQSTQLRRATDEAKI